MYHQWPSTSINKWPPGKRNDWNALQDLRSLQTSTNIIRHHKGVTRVSPEKQNLCLDPLGSTSVFVCVRVFDGFGWIWMDLDGFGWIWMDLDGYGWIWMDLGYSRPIAPSYPRIMNPFQKCEASPTHPLTSTYLNLACVFPKPGGVRKRTRPGGMSGQRHRSMSPVFSGSLAFSSVAQLDLFRWSTITGTVGCPKAAASGQMSTISSIVWGPKTSFSSSTWAVRIWSWIIMVFKKDFWSFRQI